MTGLRIFVEHNIEKYVIGDLWRMRFTGVGYPMIMTAFAGIELLGGLLSRSPWKKENGSRYFAGYWADYLYPTRFLTRKRSVKAADCVYQLVRHGIAHAYVLQGAIGIAGDARGEHLTRSNGTLIIDCRVLADDFIASYESHVRPALSTKTDSAITRRMAAQLARMEEAYGSNANTIKCADVFPPAPPANQPLDYSRLSGGSPPPFSGQTGASGPVGVVRSMERSTPDEKEKL